ncbi:SDR family oxidoreductase [Castellaniella sp. S9]|uniref:SDR family oxidoreductase n=1 Tax=Castellaniella sp. S9 TaxID=2993652 RepID=UPI0022B54495|nr:SDR family oxidoreductase [Castellaniella sp. S9]
MSIIQRLLVPQGLRVLITGGAAGIGAAIAEGFLEARARVYVCDVDAPALAAFRRDHPDVLGAVIDVSEAAAVARAVDEAAQDLGGLDVLVNNAGIAGPTGGIHSLAASDWQRTIDTNLNSQFYFLHHSVPHLKQSPHSPHIVAMSSVAGRLGYPFRTPYAASKWAVVGLMKSLAAELGPDGVRVNAVLPGVVSGPRMDRVIAARAQALDLDDAAMREQYLQKISLRRMVSAEDIAAMALFLSTPAAANITGQAISVDGNVEYL